MSYNNPKDLIFKSSAEVKAFAKWYLSTAVDSSVDYEYSTELEKEDYLYRRMSRLEVQVDNLRDLNMQKPFTTAYENQTMYKLVKDGLEPLTTEGSDKKSSRFNFKEANLFKNKVAYFGQDKDCCYSEIFHNDFMRLSYDDFEKVRADELPRPKFKLIEFKISTPNLLVVTSSSTLKGLGISEGVFKDEWFDLNLSYEIPSSSQIFASIAKSKGYKGILYCSVRHQTKYNLVLFEENIGKLESVCKKISETTFDLDIYERGLGIKKTID